MVPKRELECRASQLRRLKQHRMSNLENIPGLLRLGPGKQPLAYTPRERAGNFVRLNARRDQIDLLCFKRSSRLSARSRPDSGKTHLRTTLASTTSVNGFHDP